MSGSSLVFSFYNFFKDKNRGGKKKKTEDKDLSRLGLKYEDVVDFKKIMEMSPEDRKRNLLKALSYLDLTVKEQDELIKNPFLCKLIVQLYEKEINFDELRKMYKKKKTRRTILEIMHAASVTVLIGLLLGFLYININTKVRKHNKEKNERRLVPYNYDFDQEPFYTKTDQGTFPDYTNFAPEDEEENRKFFSIGVYKGVPYVLYPLNIKEMLKFKKK